MPQDYPPGRGRVSLEAAGIPIEGVSIAGHESFYKLPTLRTLLEFGRAPEDVVGYATVCVSHGHLDHIAGPGALRVAPAPRRTCRRRASSFRPRRPRTSRSGSRPARGWSVSTTRSRSCPRRPGDRAPAPQRPRADDPSRAGTASRRSGICSPRCGTSCGTSSRRPGRSRDRRAARLGRRGHAAGGDPAPRVSGRLRRRRSSRSARSSSARACPPARVLVPPPGGSRPGARIRAHPPRRHRRERRPLRERGHRAHALLPALRAGGDPAALQHLPEPLRGKTAAFLPPREAQLVRPGRRAGSRLAPVRRSSRLLAERGGSALHDDLLLRSPGAGRSRRRRATARRC